MGENLPCINKTQRCGGPALTTWNNIGLQLGGFKLTVFEFTPMLELVVNRLGATMTIRHYFLWGIAVTLAEFISSAPLQADLIGQWHFDETGGSVAADVLGVNDGALMGDATFVFGGRKGNAVRVSKAGNGYVSYGDIFSLTSGDFTIIVWIKTAPGDQQPELFPFGKHVAGFFNGYFVAINAATTYGQTAKAWFYMSNSPGEEIISTSTVNDGNWHQIAVVYLAGDEARIYVDGGTPEAKGASIPIIQSLSDLHAGAIVINNEADGYFDGLIDEIQIYDEALTDADIQFMFLHPALSLHEFADGFESF